MVLRLGLQRVLCSKDSKSTGSELSFLPLLLKSCIYQLGLIPLSAEAADI